MHNVSRKEPFSQHVSHKDAPCVHSPCTSPPGEDNVLTVPGNVIFCRQEPIFLPILTRISETDLVEEGGRLFPFKNMPPDFPSVATRVTPQCHVQSSISPWKICAEFSVIYCSDLSLFLQYIIFLQQEICYMKEKTPMKESLSEKENTISNFQKGKTDFHTWHGGRRTC